jgi:ribosomal protein S18 acetylase RimI-like enzyme
MNRSLLKDYTSLINRARADWPRNRDLTTKQAELTLYGNPNYDENNHLLAYVKNKLVAECSSIIYPEDATKTEPTAIIELSVLPKYRRTGIGTKLIEKTRQRLKQLNVKEIQVEVPAACKESRKFYEKLGFTTTDKTFELAINLHKKLPEAQPLKGYTIRSPKFPKEKAEFLQVWNKANAETTDASPALSPEAFESFLAFPKVQSLYLVAVREKDYTIIGVLTCFIDPAYNKKNKVKEAQIEITGVLPEERNKGIATAMILEATRWMKTKNITTALATVNSQNQSTLAMSKKLGAQITSEQLTYRLRI